MFWDVASTLGDYGDKITQDSTEAKKRKFFCGPRAEMGSYGKFPRKIDIGKGEYVAQRSFVLF